jgi:uncharacterized protein DUF4249
MQTLQRTYYNRSIALYIMIMIFSITFSNCIKPFNPPALQAKNNYLVVDGFINTSANKVTTINLSRTRSISDSIFTTEPELNASIQIVSKDGAVYPLSEKSNGVYQSAILNLDNAKAYQIKIKTSNGSEYSSEYASCLQTPAIDSLTWRQPDDVIIYLYTHDPANNTRYYKWDFTETWQYNSIFQTVYGIDENNIINILNASNEIDSCWENDESAQIMLGNSVKLSDDVISHQKIATIPRNDLKIYVRYSILVRQHALTAEGYKYWQIVEKNSQDRGGLFDLQPGQLQGNVHSETDITEPVIGYINASSQTEYRLFIGNRELNGWYRGPNKCDLGNIPQDPNNYRNWYYQDSAWLPYFFSGSDIVISRKICLDCRSHGGTNKRPSFW